MSNFFSPTTSFNGNVGAYLAGIMGMGPAQTTTQQTSSQTILPAYLTQASQATTNLAEQIGNTGYEAYAGNPVAGLSSNQQGAYNLAATQSGNLGALSGLSNTAYSAGALAPYESQYLQGALQPQLSTINQNYDQQRSALNSNPQSVAAQNAYNAQGNANNNAALNANQNYATTQATAAALPAAYSYAQNAFMNCRAQAQQIVNQNQSALASTGQAAQNVQQAEDTFGYGQYLQQQQWGTQTLGALTNALKAASAGAPTTNAGTETGQQQQNSSGSEIGALAGLVAAFV